MKTLHRLPDNYFTEDTHYSNNIMTVYGCPIVNDLDGEKWALGYNETPSNQGIRIMFEVSGELFWLTYFSDSMFIVNHFELIQ